MSDLTLLRELAQAATPGPWIDNERAVYWVIVNSRAMNVAGGLSANDATYIKAISPDVILSLLDEIDAAKAVLECGYWQDTNDDEPCGSCNHCIDDLGQRHLVEKNRWHERAKKAEQQANDFRAALERIADPAILKPLTTSSDQRKVMVLQDLAAVVLAKHPQEPTA